MAAVESLGLSRIGATCKDVSGSTTLQQCYSPLALPSGEIQVHEIIDDDEDSDRAVDQASNDSSTELRIDKPDTPSSPQSDSTTVQSGVVKVISIDSDSQVPSVTITPITSSSTSCSVPFVTSVHSQHITSAGSITKNCQNAQPIAAPRHVPPTVPCEKVDQCTFCDLPQKPRSGKMKHQNGLASTDEDDDSPQEKRQCEAPNALRDVSTLSDFRACLTAFKDVLLLQESRRTMQEDNEDDVIFGRHITHELRSITDPQLKRWAKLQIQTVIYQAQSNVSGRTALTHSPDTGTTIVTPGEWIPMDVDLGANQPV
ncbi:uncharacterized protein LOC135377901 isoform X2 [Ornithodoros turicata]|uniref:uncharacterized protein LOC135377901 isoform X2 n=1 Tax=Ornithodoros turicata TaxID=34597 RepID=UPI003139E6E5